MTATLLDGKALSELKLAELSQTIAQLKSTTNKTPKLVVVLVGNNPASQTYVNKKAKVATTIGMAAELITLDENTAEAELLAVIKKLNQDPTVHGILVQLPLPQHINTQKIIEAITPEKDVDGFHPTNVGKLSTGLTPYAVACTPLGVMEILKHYQISVSGQHAVIIGRSNIVGKPLAQLLLAANATVTIAHSKTQNLPQLCKQADILIAAVGIEHLVKADWVKPQAVVIDVGINRNSQGKLVGDVDTEGVKAVASAITPVPGGVGPMTVTCLMQNTLNCFKARL